MAEEFKILPVRRGFTEVQPLFDLCQRVGAIICGGYARYCASPLPTPEVFPAHDADMFPQSEQATEDLRTALKDMGFEERHENHVSVTFSAPKDRPDLKYIPIPQVIKPVIEGAIVTLGTVEEILENFDFTVVRVALISPTEAMVDPQFEDDETHHYLRLKNIHCPISSLLRCCKYARKGYFMRPIESLKLFNDWTDRGDDYRMRLTELFSQSGLGLKSEKNPEGMTREEIDELESLLRID